MPLTCERTKHDRVRVSMCLPHGAVSTIEISEGQARTLAASLLVAASKDATSAASNVVEGVELMHSGADFIGRLQKLAKGVRR